MSFRAFWIKILYFYFSMNVFLLCKFLDLCWRNAICPKDSFLYCANLLCAFLESWGGRRYDLLQKAPWKKAGEVGRGLGKYLFSGKAGAVEIPSTLPEQSQTCNIRKAPFQGKSNAAEMSPADIMRWLIVVMLDLTFSFLTISVSAKLSLWPLFTYNWTWHLCHLYLLKNNIVWSLVLQLE